MSILHIELTERYLDLGKIFSLSREVVPPTKGVPLNGRLWRTRDITRGIGCAITWLTGSNYFRGLIAIARSSTGNAQMSVDCAYSHLIIPLLFVQGRSTENCQYMHYTNADYSHRD